MRVSSPWRRQCPGNTTGSSERILPKPTTWVGGLHAVLQRGIKESFQQKRTSSSLPWRFNHLQCLAAKVRNPSGCIIQHVSREKIASLKFTHGETIHSKVKAITQALGLPRALTWVTENAVGRRQSPRRQPPMTAGERFEWDQPSSLTGASEGLQL